MPQIFRPGANTLARLSLVLFALSAPGGLVLLDVLFRSPYVTGQGLSIVQPVPFSHKHHAEMGIDCRYCHGMSEETSFAGIPSTRTCMNCHSQIWPDSPVLEPVRESARTGKPLEWIKVHDLPDFVYFDHSIHVAKGVGCATCHGRVDRMPRPRIEHPLQMRWCLECHRAPEQFVRPREMVTAMNYEPPADQPALGRKLVEEYGIDTRNHRLSDCALCHR
jgi:hypothetical protein